MQPKVADASEEDTKSQTSRAAGGPSSNTSPELSNVQFAEEVGKKSAPTPDAPAPPQSEPSFQSPPYYPPNTSTPAISPPRSPQMYQQHLYSGQPLPYGYGYPQNPNMLGGFYPGHFSPSGRELPRSPSVVNREDHQKILEKVTNVLPDINKLLEHYQETQGQLSAKDLMVKQAELMRAEEIARLRLELDAKKEEYDKLIERLVGENYKYKLEVEEKNATIAALEEAAKGHQALKEEVEMLKTKCDEAVSTADVARLAKEQLLATKLRLEEQHKRDIQDLKVEHKSVFEAKENDHNKAASEHKVVLSKVQLELANLITKHSSVRKEVEASRGNALALEQRLETAAKEHEAAVAAHHLELQAKAKEADALQDQHRQQLEVQLESLTSSRQQEVQSLQEAHDQKLKDLTTEHESYAAKLAEDHAHQMTDAQSEVDRHKGAFSRLQSEHDDMGAKHKELSGAMLSWKKSHEAWQGENDKLNKLLERLGQGGDSKTNET